LYFGDSFSIGLLNNYDYFFDSGKIKRIKDFNTAQKQYFKKHNQYYFLSKNISTTDNNNTLSLSTTGNINNLSLSASLIPSTQPIESTETISKIQSIIFPDNRKLKGDIWFSPDCKQYRVWLYPTTMLIFPYNYVVGRKSYYSDQTGVIRCEKVSQINARAGPDSPPVQGN